MVNKLRRQSWIFGKIVFFNQLDFRRFLIYFFLLVILSIKGPDFLIIQGILINLVIFIKKNFNKKSAFFKICSPHYIFLDFFICCVDTRVDSYALKILCCYLFYGKVQLDWTRWVAYLLKKRWRPCSKSDTSLKAL